jgi:hypothetical protein
VTRAAGALACIALACIALACGARSRGSAAGGDAIVYLRSNVRDAQVYVDGRFVAPLSALGGGLAIEPGTHRVELRHEDYFSSYLELQLARAERRNVALEMAAILP